MGVIGLMVVGLAQRLSARRHELAVEAAGCFDELDYLDDPEDYLEDIEMEPGDESGQPDL